MVQSNNYFLLKLVSTYCRMRLTMNVESVTSFLRNDAAVVLTRAGAGCNRIGELIPI